MFTLLTECLRCWMKTFQQSQRRGLLSFLSSGLCWLENGNTQWWLVWAFWSFASLFSSCQRYRRKASELFIILFSSISLCSVGKCLQKQQPSAFLNSRNKQKCGELPHGIFYTYLPKGPRQLIWVTLRPHCPPPLTHIMLLCTQRDIKTAVHRTKAALKWLMNYLSL